MIFKDRKFSAPTAANLEITEKCNARCLHCYNPWREEHMGVNTLDFLKIKKSMDALKKAGVFHVVLTGGEPMAKMENLLEAPRYGQELGFSFSCNSNLMLTTPKKMKQLRDLGLDHILTSFPSIDKPENDRIMQVKDSVKKIERGIKNALDNDIRVSINMVITKFNYKRVYDTGKYIADLGCQKFFVTRAVPPVYSTSEKKPEVPIEYQMTHEEAKSALDQAIRVKEEFGVGIGSLVNYPICFLGDLEKYKDFVGRGCPSQRGHRLNVNATGDLHVCVHEETSYGNLFKEDLSEVYTKKMNSWHDKEKMIYEGCKGCEFIPVCYSGCQMVALAFNGKLGTKDPLYVGPNKASKNYMLDDSFFEEIEKVIENGDPILKVNKNLRFRKENGFSLINIQWANTITMPNLISDFLQNTKSFKFREFPFGMLMLKFLILKNIISTEGVKLDKDEYLKGLSVNIEALPYFKDLNLNL